MIIMKEQHAARWMARIALAGIAGLAIAGCEDLLTETPPNSLAPETVFATQTGLEQGVVALYAQARLQYTGFEWDGHNHQRNTLMMAGTDAAYGGQENDPPSTMSNNENDSQLHDNQSILRRLWTWNFQTINGANTVLARIDQPAWSSPAAKTRAEAEARFFRAWSYRHLTYLFGDVPLSLEEISGVKTDWERTPRARVLDQMVEDFTFAAENLLTKPQHASADRKWRITPEVARHYLAETLLRQGKFAEAETQAQRVVESPHYRLITARYGVRANQPGVAFMDQFVPGNILPSQGNTEVMWAMPFERGVPGGKEHAMRRTWASQHHSLPFMGGSSSAEAGGTGTLRGANTRWAFSIYEPQDQRFSVHAIRKSIVARVNSAASGGWPAAQAGDTVWLPQPANDAVNDFVNIASRWTTRKWDNWDPGFHSPSFTIQYTPIGHLRLADTYLLLAEAQVRQNKSGAAAQSVNVIRQRSGATLVGAGQVNLDFVLDERAREFMAEEERRYVLLRHGAQVYVDRTKAFNRAFFASRPNNRMISQIISLRDSVFPVPRPVINANIGAPFPQNPGF
jgi:starch-binding outer membrane protein, SusD/RagB family